MKLTLGVLRNAGAWVVWWAWQRWRIYTPPPDVPRLHESRASVKARLNRGSWPCSDAALFYPSMGVKE